MYVLARCSFTSPLVLSSQIRAYPNCWPSKHYLYRYVTAPRLFAPIRVLHCHKKTIEGNIIPLKWEQQFGPYDVFFANENYNKRSNEIHICTGQLESTLMKKHTVSRSVLLFMIVCFFPIEIVHKKPFYKVTLVKSKCLVCGCKVMTVIPNSVHLWNS